jgi:small-conductance mechanosensitive channel
MFHLVYLYSILILVCFLFIASLAGISIKTLNLDFTKIKQSSQYHSQRRLKLTTPDLGSLKI